MLTYSVMFLYVLATASPVLTLTENLGERGWWGALGGFLIVAAWLGGLLLIALLGMAWDEAREKRKKAEQRKQREERQRRRAADKRAWEAEHPGSKYPWDSHDRGGSYGGGSGGYSGCGGGDGGGGGGD